MSKQSKHKNDLRREYFITYNKVISQQKIMSILPLRHYHYTIHTWKMKPIHYNFLNHLKLTKKKKNPKKYKWKWVLSLQLKSKKGWNSSFTKTNITASMYFRTLFNLIFHSKNLKRLHLHLLSSRFKRCFHELTSSSYLFCTTIAVNTSTIIHF